MLGGFQVIEQHRPQNYPKASTLDPVVQDTSLEHCATGLGHSTVPVPASQLPHWRIDRTIPGREETTSKV